MGKSKQSPAIKPAPKWGELIDGQRYFPLHQYQRAVLESPARITAAFAGTGGGKTVLIPIWLMIQIQKNGGKGRYLVVSPTYKFFRQTGLLDSWLNAIDGTPLQKDGGYNKTDKIYTCATGAEIFFRSADTPDSLEGGQYDALAIDEAAKASHDAWVKAAARVGQKMGPILLVTTPDLNNWIHKEVFSLCDAPPVIHADGAIRDSLDGKVRVVQWASTVNPTYSKEELERQRKILPASIFRRRYLGEFARMEGLVYDTFVDAVIPENTPEILPSPAVRVCAGLDWGYNDPTAVVVGAECQDGAIYTVEEICQRQLGLDELADKLWTLKRKWGIELFYCDHSRPELRDYLRRKGLPCVIKKVAGIETGIAMVDRRIRAGRLRVYLDCRNLIDESERYKRVQLKDGDYDEKPEDKNNHSMDSLRYLITGMDHGRSLDFSDRPVTAIAQLDVETQAGIRLGRLSPDADERRKQAEEVAIQKQAAWLYQMAFGDLDD